MKKSRSSEVVSNLLTADGYTLIMNGMNTDYYLIDEVKKTIRKVSYSIYSGCIYSLIEEI